MPKIVLQEVGQGGPHDLTRAQVAQANAAVESERAAIENNRRQRELQDARIEQAPSSLQLFCL